MKNKKIGISLSKLNRKWLFRTRTMSNLKLLFVLMLFFTYFFVAVNTYASKDNWTTEVVDSNGNVGSSNSIAIDTSGNVHISYYDDDNNDLKYTTNASGLWLIKVLGDITEDGYETEAGFSNSIAIDKSGNAHICYSANWQDYENNFYEAVMYATNASGTWTYKIVDLADATYGCSIALDTSENVHISHYDDNHDMLKYATKSASGTWTDNIVLDAGSDIDGDGDEDMGRYNDIAVDTSGNVHISYNDRTNDIVKYATNASGTWTTSNVDVGTLWTSIAVDSNGKAHISFNNIGKIMYATNQSGSWKTKQIDIGAESSIAIDKSDTVHIAYDTIHPQGYLGYANNASGSWETTTAEFSSGGGWFPSIAVDTAKNVHISKYDVLNFDLKYTTNSETISTGCEALSMYASPSKLTLNVNESGDVVVAVTGDGACPVEGETVTATINKAGKKRISISPTSLSTDANGEATFTIIAKNKTGNAKVTFKQGKLKTKVKVKVVK